MSEALSLAPSKAHEAGEPRSQRDERPWVNAMWSLHSNLPWTQPLSNHLAQLCDAVEDKRAALKRLSDRGYSMDFFCFVEVENGQGGVLLTPEVLRRLAEIPVELDLHIYAEGDEAELVATERV